MNKTIYFLTLPPARNMARMPTELRVSTGKVRGYTAAMMLRVPTELSVVATYVKCNECCGYDLFTILTVCILLTRGT